MVVLYLSELVQSKFNRNPYSSNIWTSLAVSFLSQQRFTRVEKGIIPEC
jgi:hypothetical protein